MILDANLRFSSSQDLSQTAAAYNSTNVIDLGAAPTVPGGLVGTLPIDPGRGHQLVAVTRIDETFTSGGAATLQVQLVMSAAEALTTPTIIDDTGAIALASLVAGRVFKLTFFPVPTPLRYLGLIYTIGTATTTAGTASAWLALDRQTNPTFPTWAG